MAITASSITADNTLDEFRIQFNNLVTDVEGVASLSAFGESITFDGATTGGSKTTITVVDPTAGNIIRCEFPQTSDAKRKEPDPETSGLYMIKELAHYFDGKGSYSKLKLVRDTAGRK